MPKITRADAVKIADKLLATFKEGGKHRIAMIYYQGIKITQFGIRHDKKSGHDYVADQIYMSREDSLIFGRCEISYDEWVSRMQDKGHIARPPEPEMTTEPTLKQRKKRHNR